MRGQRSQPQRTPGWNGDLRYINLHKIRPLTLLQTSIHSLFGLPGDHRKSTDSPSSRVARSPMCTNSTGCSTSRNTPLFAKFLFMKHDEFYQDIYNDKPSEDTMSSLAKEAEVVVSRLLPEG